MRPGGFVRRKGKRPYNLAVLATHSILLVVLAYHIFRCPVVCLVQGERHGREGRPHHVFYGFLFSLITGSHSWDLSKARAPASYGGAEDIGADCDGC
ncbi:uncharacterized protein B0T15DRAFT_519567 [Chaetomium strumarium]|uniref:Uncharacterized protein n=1 Tax=Chaetomium strumarium TaxID=1170767 RepID=A0AAJ0H2W3_9PEZI|nr:hypothetical protein B0T15DRAFT_519567 [Chaetomium strumarium]